MKIRYLIIAIVIILISCKINKNVFTNIDLNSGKFKLYFINSVSFANQKFPDCEFQNQHCFFCIDDISVLKKIQQNYIKKTDIDVTPNQTKCFYALQLILEKKLVWGGFIDWNNSIMKSSKDRYIIDIPKLISDSTNYRKIECYKANIHELSVARNFYDLLVQNGAILYGLQFLNENPLFEYNGEFCLKTDTTKLSISRKGKDIDNEILNDLKGLGKIRIKDFHCDIDGSEINITIQSEKNIDKLIPKKYIISKAYSPIENIELLILDINEKDLSNLIAKNKLQGITFEKK